MVDVETTAVVDDVANLYRLVLRRAPESEMALQANLGMPLSRLVYQFFASQEYEVLARHPVQDQRVTRLSYETMDIQAAKAIVRRLGFVGKQASAICAVGSPLEFHYRLLKACNEAGYFDYEIGWLEKVDGGRQVPRGGVLGVDSQAVAGWALPRPGQGEFAEIEVWSSGQVIARGTANRFDPQVAEHFPDTPNAAFWIALPQPDEDRVLDIELREVGLDGKIGVAQVLQTCVDRGVISRFERSLKHLQTQIEDLKADFPNLAHQVAFPIENYGQYYDRYLSEPFDEPLYTDIQALVLVQTLGAEPVEIEACLRSILNQSHPRLRLALVSAPETRVLYEDLCLRFSSDFGGDIQVIEAGQLAELPPSDLVVVLSGRSQAHSDMVAAAAVYLEAHSEKDGVYFDEDCLDLKKVTGVLPARVSPRFKPSFDADLLMQTPYIGSVIALRAGAWADWIAKKPVLSSEAASHLALALDESGKSVGHWPIVMTSWASDTAAQSDEAAWAAVVAQSLEARGWQAQVEPSLDVLGADTQGRRRLVWALPQPVTASVIIPTRDRLDLLKPCVDSLLAHEDDNVTRMELIIVDHESTEPETLAYLAELASFSNVRILPHKGPFNWALKNNLAAKIATGQVLVFLNNDTLVLSKSWLDELTAQALRPGVGAVGCRLVYPDQSLQHGGFVASPRFSDFLSHEGLNERGNDGGYLGRHTVVRQTTAVTGACMSVSAERFIEIGGFEAAAFPVDGNDVDFCFRARSKGYRILYTPFSTFYHLESKSRGVNAGDKEHENFLSALGRLWQRWGKLYGNDPYYNSNFDRAAHPFLRLSYASRLL